MFEHIIEPAYHLSGMGRTGFGTDKTPAILQRLHTLYRKPSLGDVNTSFLRLHDTMDRNQLAEMMIRAIEDVQLLLLLNPKDNMSLPNTALINYAMIKIKNTDIHYNALALWNSKAGTDHIVWKTSAKYD